MQNKKPNFKFIWAVATFIIMFGTVTVIKTYALSPLPVSKQTLDTCVARIFELDREEIFADVSIQEYYTHAVNFLKLIEDDSITDPLPKFYPKRAIRRGEFISMVRTLNSIRDEPNTAWESKFTWKNQKRKINQREIAEIIKKALGVPVTDTLLKSAKPLRKDAAYILYETAKKVFEDSPEFLLCKKHAIEDPEQFEENFGEGGEGPEEQIPPEIKLPAPESQTQPEPPASSLLPIIKNATINFAPVNPRAGETVKVTVRALDAENKNVAAASLKLIATAGRDTEKTFDLKDIGNGAYEGEIYSDWAGTYTIGVAYNGSVIGDTRDLKFIPHFPAELKLDTATSQAQSISKKEAVIKATIRDKFGNIVESETRDYRVTADTATVKKVEKIGKEILITVEAKTWGEVKVDVSHLTRNAVQDVASKTKINFSSLVLDVDKGYEPGKKISIPAHLYLPKDKGKIAGYKFTLQYEKEDLVFQNVTDENPNDGFATPKVTQGDGFLKLEQTTTGQPLADEVLNIGTINFLTTTVVGSGTIFVPDGVVINDHEKVIAFPEPEGLIDDFARWWYAIKPVKETCLDVWIVEGSATRSEVMDDVEKASGMFSIASALSYCPFWLNFSVNFHQISAADWSTKVENGASTPNQLDPGEEANLRNNFQGDPACLQVWYVNAIKLNNKDLLGVSYNNKGGVAVDNGADYDNRTLGHELAHQMSRNQVLDSPDDAGNAQGARDNGNPMNYDHPGDNFTKEQCDLIKP